MLHHTGGSDCPPPSPSPLASPLDQSDVVETHQLRKMRDDTGRKYINQYEVGKEIGRGMHGKVRVGHNVQTGEIVVSLALLYCSLFCSDHRTRQLKSSNAIRAKAATSVRPSAEHRPPETPAEMHRTLVAQRQRYAVRLPS
jgi:hypothetical protein